VSRHGVPNAWRYPTNFEFLFASRPYRLEIFIERNSLHFQPASIRTATELMRIKTSLGLTYFVNANGSLAAAPR
jgi:hypothetical protein